MLKFIEGLATPMMQRATLSSHLVNDLTIFRALEITYILDNATMMATPREMILQDLWGSSSANAYDALILGESINDRIITGAAYYHILVAESPKWTEDNRLNDRHQRHLKYGNQKCTIKAYSCLDNWGRMIAELQPDSNLENTSEGYSRQSYYEYRWLHLVLMEIAGGNYVLCDVVKRHEAAIRVAPHVDNWGSDVERKLIETLNEFKTEVYNYFVQPSVD